MDPARLDKASALLSNAEVLLKLNERDVLLTRCPTCLTPVLTFHGQESTICGYCNRDIVFRKRAMLRRARQLASAGISRTSPSTT